MLLAFDAIGFRIVCRSLIIRILLGIISWWKVCVDPDKLKNVNIFNAIGTINQDNSLSSTYEFCITMLQEKRAKSKTSQTAPFQFVEAKSTGMWEQTKHSQLSLQCLHSIKTEFTTLTRRWLQSTTVATLFCVESLASARSLISLI